MKRYRNLHLLFLLVLVAPIVQSCMGIGDDPFEQSNSKNGTSIGINKTADASFKGKIYFTLDHNLYVLNGADNTHVPHQLTTGIDVRDPAVSPDGKNIAFVVRYKNYSDLAYMPATGGAPRVLRTGQGTYRQNPPYPAPKSSHHWFAQPSWSADGKTLLYLSDEQKEDWYVETHQNAPMLDLQGFSISMDEPDGKAQNVAFADYGAGGNRDLSYRPGSNNEVVYTHYTYDSKNLTQELAQLYLEDVTLIEANPRKYHPGTAGQGLDPAVPITPAETTVRNFHPAFSPDGKALAYIRSDTTTNQMGLFIMKVPDGVTANPDDADAQKKVLDLYQQSSLLYKGGLVSQPVWSPDGQHLIFLTNTDGSFDIWLANITVDAKGSYHMKGDPIQLTAANGHLDAESRPFWSK